MSDPKSVDVSSLGSVEQLVRHAKQVLPADIVDYIELGASGEVTVQQNKLAFGRWQFLPQMLSGVGTPDLRIRLGTLDLSLPVITAPFGNDGLMHSEGHRAIARATRAWGTTNVMPHGASTTLEEVARAAEGRPGVFQLGLSAPEDDLLGIADRAAEAGYRYLLFTHLPARSWRERLYENRTDLSPYSRANYAGDKPTLDLAWDWERFTAFVANSPLPWFFKGTQRPEDARRVLDLGAAGLYVSNYGGRNLDSTPPSVSFLPGVAAEAQGSAPVIFDSGIRRGTDVVKALCLGATCVAVGRLSAFALAAGGASGVTRLLELLEAEIRAVMAELGAPSVAALDSSHLVEVADFPLTLPTGRNREF